MSRHTDCTTQTWCRAFTLVELLVVIGIIGLLIGILLPALIVARQKSQAVACSSNIRQLAVASLAYVQDEHGFWPPAHVNFYMENLSRWHGVRTALNLPFDFAKSPLLKYLQTAQIKKCPSFEPAIPGFEAACGGYGYNNHYLGSSSDQPDLASLPLGPDEWDQRVGNVPAKQVQIRRSAEKIAFTDAAMMTKTYIEYSFAEPPTTTWGPTSPSIHFRHRGRANIAWADGHVTAELMEWTYNTPNAYGANNQKAGLGWFGPKDNSLFQRQ